jgi:hypothetical protein
MHSPKSAQHSLVTSERCDLYKHASHAAEVFESMILTHPPLADIGAATGGVSACVKALLAPDTLVKPRTITLRSALPAGLGTDTPKVWATRVLKHLCTHSPAARMQLARAPPGVPHQ